MRKIEIGTVLVLKVVHKIMVVGSWKGPDQKSFVQNKMDGLS